MFDIPLVVLMIEDSSSDARYAREMFKEVPYPTNLYHVSDGAEAVDFLFHRGRHRDVPRPDLVLLDLDLPKVNGRELLQSIKADPNLKNVAVVVVTGSHSLGDMAAVFRNGGDFFLSKPLEPQLLSQAISSFERFPRFPQ